MIMMGRERGIAAQVKQPNRSVIAETTARFGNEGMGREDRS